MKKRGFTLVELLAVIVILGILSIVLVPTVDRSIKEFRKNSYHRQIGNIELSAKSWGVDHPFELPKKDQEVITITLGSLKNSGYVDYKIKNPKTDRFFPNDMLIEVKRTGNNYQYRVIENSGTAEGEYEVDAPLLSLKGASTIYVEFGETYIEPGFQAKNSSGIVIPNDRVQIQTYYNSQPVASINTKKLGTYTIEYMVTDREYTTKVRRNVIVRDTIPPVITVDGHTSNFTVNHEASSSFAIPNGSASDNSGEVITVSRSGGVTANIPGTYRVTYTAKDSSQNTTTLVMTVIVTDTKAPTFTVSGNPSNWTNQNVTIAVNATDSGSGLSTKGAYSFDDGKTWQAGNTKVYSTNQTIKIKVRDNVGNISATQTIVISKIDKNAPDMTFATISGTTGNNGWYKSNVGVKLTPSAGSSGVKNYQYCIGTSNCTPSTTVNGGGTTNVSLTSESRTNQICVNITSNSGSTNTKCSSLYKIDKTAPTIKINGCTSSGNCTVNLEATTGSYTIPGATVTDNLTTGLTASKSGSVTPSLLGTYYVNYTSTDEAGNTGTSKLTVVVADTIKPTFTVSGNPSSWTKNDVTLTINATDSGSGLHRETAYSFDNGATWQASKTKTFTNNQTVNIKVRDQAGNVSNGQAIVINKIDKTIPNANFAFVSGTAGSNSWYKSDVVLKITPTAGGSGVTSYKYCTTTSSCTPTTSISGSGTTNVTLTSNSSANKVCVITTNGAGVSSGTICSSLYKIDKGSPTAPTITMKLKDASGTTYNGTCTRENVYVELNSSSTSGISKYEWLENGTWTTRALTTSNNKGIITYSSERNLELQFHGVNNAGTTGATSKAWVKIDRTAPTIKINGCASSGNCTINLEAAKSYTIPNAVASDSCGISSTTPTKSGSVTPSIPGTYYVTYTAKDIAGNTGTAQLTVVVVDTTKPNLTFTMDPAQPNGLSSWYKSNVKFNVTASDVQGVQTLQYALSTDGGNTWGNYTNISSNTFTISTQGSNLKVRMKAVDKSNNTMTVESGTFKIDTVLPTISSVTGNPTSWTKNNVTLTVNASDATSKIKEYSFDNGTTWQTGNTKAYSSNQTVNVKVKDNAGNISAVNTVTINKIDKTAPVITVDGHTSSYTVNHEASSSYTIPAGSVTDNSGATITLNKSGNVTPSIPGTYKVTYTATDPAGNTATLIMTVIVADTKAPTFTVAGNPTSWTNKDVTLTISANDAGSGLHKSGAYSFDNGATWVTSASKAFSSNQTVTIKVRDNVGNVATVQTVTINRIDKTTPNASFAFVSGTAGSNSWYKSDVVVKITSSAGGSGVTSYKYCTTTSSCTPTTTVSGSGTTNVTLNTNSSANKVCVITTNGAGVSSGTVCSSAYKIDKATPPAPTITMKLNNASGSAYTGACTKENVYVEMTSSSTSGISKFEWYESGWKTSSLTTANNKGTITFTSERNGTFKFRGTNAVGTIGAETSKTIKIDRTAPTIKISRCASNGNCTINIEATSSYTIPTATASDSCGISNTTPTKSGSVTANLPGTYYVNYTATDIAGNTGTAQLTVVVKDTVKPNISFAMSPAQPNGLNNWYTGNVTFTTKMSDISGVTSQQYALSANGGSTWGSYTNISNNTFTISTQGGNLKVRMKAVDKAGNTTTVDSGVFKIDGASPVITNLYAGSMLYRDPIFASGLNSTYVYDNSGGGTVTNTRTAMTTPVGSYALKITTNGTASPGLGGFTFRTNSAANKQFIARIIAKIPTGYNIAWASNATGTGSTTTWLTSTAGTGDWKEYVVLVSCGATGTFSTTNYFYINGTAATASNPISWYVAYATVFDTTAWGQENYLLFKGTDNLGVVGYGFNQSSTSQPSYTNISSTTSLGAMVTTPITSNGTYYLWLKDVSGRTVNKAVSVSKVDRTPPVITVDGHTSDYTVSSVVADNSFSDWMTEEELKAAGIDKNAANVQSKTQYQITYDKTVTETKTGSKWAKTFNAGGIVWQLNLDTGVQTPIRPRTIKWRIKTVSQDSEEGKQVYANNTLNLQRTDGTVHQITKNTTFREDWGFDSTWTETLDGTEEIERIYLSSFWWKYNGASLASVEITSWDETTTTTVTTPWQDSNEVDGTVKKTETRTLYRYLREAYKVPEATATDNSGTNITVVKSGNVSPTLPGTYKVTYTATDPAGNTKTLVLTVNLLAPTYSDWMTEADLNTAGHHITETNVQSKAQYQARAINASTTSVGNVSHSCSNRGSCSRSTCITSGTFTSRYIKSVAGSCTFRNIYAGRADSVRCYIQGNSTASGWVTISDKSGTRGTNSSTTLTPSGNNTSYSSHQFTQLRLCWSMGDENELSMSGSVNNWFTYGTWGSWTDCSGSCPATSTTEEVTTRFLYRYRTN